MAVKVNPQIKRVNQATTKFKAQKGKLTPKQKANLTSAASMRRGKC